MRQWDPRPRAFKPSSSGDDGHRAVQPCQLAANASSVRATWSGTLRSSSSVRNDSGELDERDVRELALVVDGGVEQRVRYSSDVGVGARGQFGLHGRAFSRKRSMTQRDARLDFSGSPHPAATTRTR